MFFYIVLTPKSTTSGLRCTGNTRKYHQIDVYNYQCECREPSHDSLGKITCFYPRIKYQISLSGVQEIIFCRTRSGFPLFLTFLSHIPVPAWEKDKLEGLTVLKGSPDLLNNVKIGQDHLQLIMKHILFYGGCGHFGQVT